MPPYSNLSTCEFVLFIELKEPTKGQIDKIRLHRWKSSKVYQKILIRSASRIGKNVGINLFIISEGDYFEGDNVNIDK